MARPVWLVLSMVSIAILIGGCVEQRGALPEAAQSSPAEPQAVFVNGGDCPPSADPQLRPNAGCVTSATGNRERLAVYAILDREARPKSWWLSLDSAEHDVVRRLRAGSEFSYPRAVGGSDVDRDGKPDWWVKVVDYTSHGAPWSGLNLFVRDQSSLVPVTFEGSPLVINFGGISRLGEGARCDNGDLVLLRAEAKNRQNTRWSLSERRLSLRGRHARLIDRREHVLVIEDYNDPKLDPYFQVECYGAIFTPFET